MSKPIDQEREAFAREDRYIVIKLSDLAKIPAKVGIPFSEQLIAIQRRLPKRECLVIESDWPEHPVAWAMIEARMTGKQPAGVERPDSLPELTDRLQQFLEVVRSCERLASDYSGSLDGVDEHGGDDHEDPICAVFHRLYYAMFDGDKLLTDLRAMLAAAPHPVSGEQKADELHRLDKQCRDDVARSMGMNPKGDGYAWSCLLAGIKIMATRPAAQDVSGQCNQVAAHLDEEVARLISIAVPGLREHGSHSLAAMLEAAVEASRAKAQGGAK